MEQKKVENRDKKLKLLPKQARENAEARAQKAMEKETNHANSAEKKPNTANKKIKALQEKELAPLQEWNTNQKQELTQLKADYMESLKEITKLKKEVKNQAEWISRFNEKRIQTQQDNAERKLEH